MIIILHGIIIGDGTLSEVLLGDFLIIVLFIIALSTGVGEVVTGVIGGQITDGIILTITGIIHIMDGIIHIGDVARQ